MKEIIQQRIVALSKEVEALHNEREAMFQRDKEIDVRLHQLVGAIYEMQQLITHLGHQPALADQIELVGQEQSLQTDQTQHQTLSETDDQSTEQ